MSSQYFVDFLKNNENINEGINEIFVNKIKRSNNPHLLFINGKPLGSKSKFLNQLLAGFQENNEKENDNNYFSLNEPFRKQHGKIKIFCKIKLSELLKRNCCKKYNNMEDADLFIVDSAGLNSLKEYTSAYISGILTLLQVSSIKIFFIGKKEMEDVKNAEKLIKLSDVVNYKNQNQSSQKIVLLKKNASIDRKIKKIDDILTALNKSNSNIQDLFFQNLDDNNIPNNIEFSSLPDFDRASDNKEYGLAYKECMKNLAIKIGKSVQNNINNKSDLIKKINFFINFFGKINNITQLNNLGEVFEKTFEQKAGEYFGEINNNICNLINNMNDEIFLCEKRLENVYSFINNIINNNKKIEMEILMNSIPKKIEILKKYLSFQILNKLIMKLSDYIENKKVKISNSIKNQNINELISIIKNSAYQDGITQEIINQYYDKYKSKIEKQHENFLNYCLNNNERNSFYQQLNDDYLEYAIILKSERPIWKDALNNHFEFISSKIIDELSKFNNEQLMQIKNNIEEYYNKEFESLRNINHFNIFNKDDYSSKIEQTIENIKEEINKRFDTYFPATPYIGPSVMDGLKEIGAGRSYEYRERIAEKNNIENYTGTPEQNLKMLKLLQEGKLLKPDN